MKKFVSIMLMLALILTLLPTMALTKQISAQEGVNVQQSFYVSVDGNDSNNGSMQTPFATLERARDAVREINSNMTGDIVVFIMEGTYYIEDSLELTSEDSGTNGYNIHYESYGDAAPVISGGTKITGWMLHDGSQNIYKAVVPDGFNFRQLYVDNQKAIRARNGLAGTYTDRIIGANRIDSNGNEIPEALNNSSTAAQAQAADGTIFVSTAEFNTSWNNLQDIELHVLTAWVENILRVKSVSTEGNQVNIKVQDEEALMVFNRPHPNIDGYSHMSTRNFIYYIENAYELINEDNEWYLDRQTNTLYYKAPQNMDLNEAEVIAPAVETLVKISGTLDNPVHNIQFSGLTFAHSNWLYPSENGLVGGQASQYVVKAVFATNDIGVARPAAGIYIECANNLRFENNTIRFMGATGIDFHWGTHDNVFINNTVTDISGNGISVGKFVVDEDTDYHVPYNPNDSREICVNEKILNNYVTNIGTDYEGSVSIAAGYPEGIMIANNTIKHAPYTGISLGYGWTSQSSAMKNNRILRNKISNVTEVLCDAGGIYTLSNQPGSEIAENYIYDITLPAWADYGTCGIYLDECSDGFLVRENVILKAYGIALRGDSSLLNNYVYQSGISVVSARMQTIINQSGVQENFDESTLYNPTVYKAEYDISNSVVTISGSGLGIEEGDITFTSKNGTVNASEIITWTETKVECILPEGAVTGTVYITTNDGNQTNKNISVTINKFTITEIFSDDFESY